jgi:SAM-dependent methyltransferase
MSDYLFDQAWTQEKRRLDALAEAYDDGTFERLARLGVAPGRRCLEVGAGNGTVARWMASRVGPTGAVVATDIDPRFLEELATGGIDVRRHDVGSDPLEERAFDVIHTRAVLQHVPKRAEALTSLVRALRPGGWLLVEDIVAPSPAAYPALPVWGKILDGMNRGFRSVGADPYYGLAVPSLMAAAGLVDVGCDARVPMLHSGTPRMEFVSLSVEQVKDRLVAAGVVTADEVAQALAAFRAPGFTMTAAIMIATSGRAPAQPPAP